MKPQPAPQPTSDDPREDPSLKASRDALAALVSRRLLRATDGMAAAAVAAFVSGWCSALDAVAEVSEIEGQEADRVAWLRALLERLQAAQEAALDEDR